MMKNETQKLYNSITNVSDAYIEEAQASKGHRSGAVVWRRVAAIAACIAILLTGGIFGLVYKTNAVASVISLDVNPSIELKVNSRETVISCTPVNEDAEMVLSDMTQGKDLKGVKLDVAVNAIVGALLRCGYLDSISSVILISVEDSDDERAARLRQELIGTVDAVLREQAANASVLSQSFYRNGNISALAAENNISVGKAALIDRITQINGELDFASLAALTVAELHDLIETGAAATPIGTERAAAIAMEYAGVTSDVVTVREVDPELDDIPAHYDVELYHSELGEFEYKIEAYTGEVLAGVANILDINQTADIGESAAKAAAFARAGVTEADVTQLTVERKVEYGRVKYKIEFVFNGDEYEYLIDGATGSVEEYEIDRNEQNTPAPTPAPISNDIGKEAAINAALRHAGLSREQVKNLTVKRDFDDGKLEYEVDFKYSGKTYEYTIDGSTGAVLDYDIEGSGVNTTSSPSTDIGERAAVAAALAHAGLSESQISGLRVEREYDNGRLEYEIEFRCGNMEYEYTVDGKTGTVLSHECDTIGIGHDDHDDDHDDDDDDDDHDDHDDYDDHDDHDDHDGNSYVGDDIGAEAAKNAALSHAGLTEQQVSGLKVKRDVDDGRIEYDIEFVFEGKEYEYTIDGATGKIIEYDIDD